MMKSLLKKVIGLVVRPAIHYFFKERYKIVKQYVDFYDRLKIEDRVILYETRDGKSITDSPYAMFKFMLDHPNFQDFKHIWTVADFHSLSPVIEKYKNYQNVQFVERDSKEYLRYLASSKYLINNSTFQAFFIPKQNQIYINTWHGTPLKKMGFDIPGDPAHSQNVVRNFLCTDYIISPNPHTTKMFTESYKLKGIYEGEIIEEGYPRIDLTLNTSPEWVKGELRNLGLELDDNKQTILYAPTWKGTSVTKAKNDMLQIIGDIQYLKDNVGDQYNTIIKVHPFIYMEAVKFNEIKSILVPDFIDTNELLATIDILVTDYSSIFFDYLVTGNPVVFYTWDADVYEDERGQYLPNEMLPGPIVYNSRELVETIKNIGKVNSAFKESYEKMQEQFTFHEDGKVTERVIGYLFGETENRVKGIRHLSNQKEKILIYPGMMKDNGITTSFINLMNNVDYSQYDVSCITKSPDNEESLKNIDKVNKNVRFLFTPGIPVYKFSEVYRDKYIHFRGVKGIIGKRIYPDRSYAREHRRLFGKSRFDYVIDFSGYSLYWAKILLASDAKKKICYMHNDLLSDSERTINGKKPHRVNLRGLFSVYHRFDKLVSVSKGTMELNRKNLIKYADFDKFDYVMNSINPDKILQHDNQNNRTNENEQRPKMKTEQFKAKAVLKDINNFPVYSFLPGHIKAKQYLLEPEFQDEEILILRKMVDNNNIYYKFSHQYRVIGWIQGNAVKILPDEVINERKVHRLARLIQSAEDVHIWSNPYNVPGCRLISSSADYKGILLEIDKEVETFQGVYGHIRINGTAIGWINIDALNFLHYCTVHHDMGDLKKIKAIMKQRVIRGYDYRRNKPMLERIDQRVLEERKLDHPILAKIVEPGQHSVWTRPYKSLKAKFISNASEFEGKLARIVKISKTKEGSFYQFAINNNIIGWLDSNVFKTMQNLPTISQMNTEFAEEWGGTILPIFKQDHFHFVNMGRLSPEKGQDNLIKAFARIHMEYPNSELCILGKGPLKGELEALVKDLGLSESVHLMGQLENPFDFMKKCDCFVLSSHYEGQPMVLLEAMTLGMRIVATDIVANRTVLENGKYGLLVENSIEGLKEGMEIMIKKGKALNMEVFDYNKYNALAMETFYRTLNSDQIEKYPE